MKAKPKLQKMECLNWNEMVEFIEKKYSIDIRDYAGSRKGGVGTFSWWHKGKGYGDIDADGKRPSSSQIWFKEYNEELAEGKFVQPPYQDYWHFLLDTVWQGAHNNWYTSINFKDILEDDYYEVKDWQKEITELFIKEFGEEDIEVYVAW